MLKGCEMIYVRSLLAGTLALAMATALTPIVLGVYFLVVYTAGSSRAMAWDPTSCAREPLLWFVATAIFLAGCIWQYRREA